MYRLIMKIYERLRRGASTKLPFPYTQAQSEDSFSHELYELVECNDLPEDYCPKANEEVISLFRDGKKEMTWLWRRTI